MSAYLSSNDAINALTTYWMRTKRAPEDDLRQLLISHLYRKLKGQDLMAPQALHYHCADVSKRTIEEAGGCAEFIHTALVNANLASLHARYPEDRHENNDLADTYSYAPSAEVQRWINERTTGQLVGITRGYAYQSCEYAGWLDSTAYAILQEIQRGLLADLERRDCRDNETWASWQEPEQTEPQPISLAELAKRGAK